jgi:hypothetical protein
MLRAKLYMRLSHVIGILLFCFGGIGIGSDALGQDVPPTQTAADLPGGKIVKAKGSRILAKWPEHKFSKGQKLYALTNVGTGIVVELAVKVVYKKKPELFELEVANNPLGVKISSLVNAKLITPEVANANQAMFPDGPIKLTAQEDKSLSGKNSDLYLNPTSELRLAIREQQSVAARLATQAAVPVTMADNAIVLNAFLPSLNFARYLNGFGLGLTYGPAAKAKVAFRAAGAQTIQEADIERKKLVASLFLRPSFASQWLARVGVRIDAYSVVDETIKYSAASSVAGSDGRTETIKISGPGVVVEYEANVFSTMFVGLSFRPGVKQTVSVSSGTELSGSYSNQEIDLSLAYRHSFFGGRPKDLIFEARGDFVSQQISIQGVGFDTTFTDQVLTGTLAIGYLN